MEEKKFRELQMVMLSIMKDIHNVCVKHNLRYYLIGGSAIGAIRHKGYIPWDVDIDIAMPREDYDLFITKYSKNLKPCHECVSFLTRDTYSPPHALVLLKNSKIIDRSGQRQTKLRPSEIFVDILPLDVCPETEEECKAQASDLIKIKKAKYNKASWIFKGDSLWKRIAKMAIRSCYMFVSWKDLNQKQNDIMKRYSKTSKSGIWCSMASHYSYEKLSMPESYFGNPKLVPFEDTELYVPEKIIEYLTKLFGDYMKLPSQEVQERQKSVFLDAYWE